jgi:hypothetical protein
MPAVWMCWNLELEIELNTNRYSFHTRSPSLNTEPHLSKLIDIPLYRLARHTPPPTAKPTNCAAPFSQWRATLSSGNPASHAVPPFAIESRHPPVLCQRAARARPLPCRRVVGTRSPPLPVSCAALPSLRQL